MDLQLVGKRAFVSGSTRGIGYALARTLAEEGAGVIINGREEAKVAAAVRALEGEVPGASVEGIAADFADADQVGRLCRQLSSIDILVNNVGLFELKQFQEISDEDWGRYVDVNLLSGARLTRALMPAMVERDWGRILFISSESGVDVPAEMIHYGATKSAALALGNGLAKLTKGTGVTVNSILGGPTYSDGVAATVEAIAEAQSVPVADMKRAIISTNQTTLLERFIDPAEIAGMATFLASPRGSATNGAAVRVDGGVLTTIL